MKGKKFLMILLSALSFAALIINTAPTPVATISQDQTPKTLLVGGQTFGVKFYTQGVMVVNISPFETEDGKQITLDVGEENFERIKAFTTADLVTSEEKFIDFK